jgi:SAM-dependent methyltransferase
MPNGDDSGRGAELFEGRFGDRYDRYIKSPLLAGLVGRALWGLDRRAMYGAMDPLLDLADGSTVLDAACGGGLALRCLEPGRRIRYLGVDLAGRMLERARREARRRGLTGVELIRADVHDLPLDDGVADLTLTMNSLHCLARPDAAVAELARCTAPGARLVGTTLVLGERAVSDRALRRGQARDYLGPVGMAADVRGWLERAGLEEVALETSGAMVVFEARRPAA